MFKRIGKWLLWILLIPITIFAVFLIYISLADYKPPAQVKLDNNSRSALMVFNGRSIRIRLPFARLMPLMRRA